MLTLPIGHIALALATQFAVRWLTRSWTAGTAAACAWAISREITQAEYRWIEQFGGHKRANMPWWGGLDPRVWHTVHSWLDWIAPCLVTCAVAGAIYLTKRRITASDRNPHEQQ